MTGRGQDIEARCPVINIRCIRIWYYRCFSRISAGRKPVTDNGLSQKKASCLRSCPLWFAHFWSDKMCPSRSEQHGRVVQIRSLVRSQDRNDQKFFKTGSPNTILYPPLSDADPLFNCHNNPLFSKPCFHPCPLYCVSHNLHHLFGFDVGAPLVSAIPAIGKEIL